jgi:hypothetical protein
LPRARVDCALCLTSVNKARGELDEDDGDDGDDDGDDDDGNASRGIL